MAEVLGTEYLDTVKILQAACGETCRCLSEGLPFFTTWLPIGVLIVMIGA